MAQQNGAPAGLVKDSSQFDVFFSSGPAQTGGMALVVALAGQTAAQIGISTPGPSLAAAVFALLLAVYNVTKTQQVDRVTRMVLIPIVALVLFATGWGANGLVYEAGPHGAQTKHQLLPLVDTLQKENENLTRRLQLQSEELAILRKLAGVPASPSSGPSGQLDRGPLARTLDSFLAVLAPSVSAQPASTAPAPSTRAQREQLLKQLQEYQAKQQALAAEAERLRKERKEAAKQAEQSPTGLWKKW